MSPRGHLLAVDGGGSKVDAVLLSRDGEVIAATRFSSLGREARVSAESLGAVTAAVVQVTGRGDASSDGRLPLLGVYCLAGADLPQDERRMLRWLSAQGWAGETVLRNDTFAVLRAGTDRTWGVGIVCGFGTNCSAVSPEGREYRLPAIGDLSGDWGGGGDIGGTALWHSVRAQDGRGERTSLSRLVPEHFGMKRPYQVMEGIYLGRLSLERVAELAPLVFRAAADGDEVARGIVDRQADEVATMAGAAIRRLKMRDLDVHVVLGGGIFHNTFPAFFERIANGVERVAPRASIVVLTAPPVVGAAMLALDHVRAAKSAYARVRRGLTHDRLDGRLTDHAQKGS